MRLLNCIVEYNWLSQIIGLNVFFNSYHFSTLHILLLDSNMYFGYANILLAGFKNAFG